MREMSRFGAEFGKRFFSTGGKSFQSSPLGSMWESYNHHLLVNPILTKSITAVVLAFVADIVCQTYFPTSEEDKKKPLKDRINWQRTINFTFLNSVIVPPVMHYWYGLLSTKIAGTGLLAAAKRVAIDQSLFAPVIIPVFLAGTLLLEGKAEQIPDKLKADWFKTLTFNYMLWIPAQLVNFSVVPPQFRVLWANFIGFFWNIYLSDAASKKAGHVQPTDPSSKVDVGKSN